MPKLQCWFQARPHDKAYERATCDLNDVEKSGVLSVPVEIPWPVFEML